MQTKLILSVIQLPNNAFPPLHNDFKTIVELREKKSWTSVDLIAVVFEVGSLRAVTCRTGRPTTKKTVTLIDDSNKMITLTLWSDNTEKLNYSGGKSVIISKPTTHLRQTLAQHDHGYYHYHRESSRDCSIPQHMVHWRELQSTLWWDSIGFCIRKPYLRIKTSSLGTYFLYRWNSLPNQ